MSELIINPSSATLLMAFVHDLPQSMLLTGDPGVGLSTISQYIANQCQIKPLIIKPEKDEKVNIDDGIIGVEIIRRIYNQTRSKSANKRIIIIDYAERMTQQAQNAFLKLLEEPNLGLNFILVSHSTAKLLPTILSRVEKIEIKQITAEQSEELLDNLKVTDKTKRAQLLFMASGRPAEIIRLVNDDKYFDLRSSTIRDARTLLQGTIYQRLLIAQHYKDNRAAILTLLSDAANILKKSIISNPQTDTISRIDSLLNAYQQIEQNGNIRLCLAQMII